MDIIDSPAQPSFDGTSCFLSQVEFHLADTVDAQGPPAVTVERIAAGSGGPDALRERTLPFLAIPDEQDARPAGSGCLAVVAVEGRDREMARAVAALLDPSVTGIALVHVTWVPPTIESPFGGDGIDNPDVADLLAYEGAREALVETARVLRAAGFEVSTHLREDRDPANVLARLVDEQRPDLFVLGLGRHGAGIGKRVLDEVSVPVLYVKARS